MQEGEGGGRAGKPRTASAASRMGTQERKRARMDNQSVKAPLPIRYQPINIPRDTAIQAHMIPDPGAAGAEAGAVQGPGEMVELYQLYTRPCDCTVSQHRGYTYLESDRKGTPVLPRPKPTPIFHVDKAVLSREPWELLGKKVAAKAAPQGSEDFFWDRWLLVRECMVDIYRSACNYFVHRNITIEDIDEVGYAEATALCKRLFSESLTKEQVLAFCFHETALLGEAYEFYSYKCLTDHATEAEDRMSLLCLADVGGYPQWPHINACLFSGGANPEGKVLANDTAERHLEKAQLLAKAFCHGVLIKAGDEWIERPGVAALGEYEIISMRDGKSRPVLDKLGKDSVVIAKDGQQITLSPAAVAILKFNKSTLDYTVTRFKSLLPKRTRGEDRFPSDELREKKKAKQAKKSEGGGGRGKRRGGKVEIKELDDAKAKQQALRAAEQRKRDRLNALVGAISSRAELEKAWRAVVDAGPDERAPDSIDELRAAVVSSCEPLGADESVLGGAMGGAVEALGGAGGIQTPVQRVGLPNFP